MPSPLPNLRAALVCGLLISCLPPLPASAAEPSTKDQLSTRLQQDENTLQRLSAMHAEMERQGKSMKDHRGRTAEQDLRELVLTPETREQLQTLFARMRQALAADTLENAETSYKELHPALMSQVTLYNAIVDYWREYGRNDDVRSPRKTSATLQTYGIDVSERREVDRLRETFAQQLSNGEFVNAMNFTLPEMHRVQKVAALAEAAQVRARLENGTFTPALEMPVTSRCKPASKSSGDAIPSMGRNFPSAEKYRPRGGASGMAEVFVNVGRMGASGA